MIKIIDEPDIRLTRAQVDAYHREYKAFSAFSCNPQSFYEYVRHREDVRKSANNPSEL